MDPGFENLFTQSAETLTVSAQAQQLGVDIAGSVLNGTPERDASP